jgi:hypothetical protein
MRREGLHRPQLPEVPSMALC